MNFFSFFFFSKKCFSGGDGDGVFVRNNLPTPTPTTHIKRTYYDVGREHYHVRF